MLLFIGQIRRSGSLFTRFNTSHVVVYRNFIFFCDIACHGFNTSHVVVYDGFLLPKLTDQSFNTSHVVVYHAEEASSILE